MAEHKAWDWARTDSEQWLRPAEDSYYLVNRWKRKGFRRFLDFGCGLGRHSFQFALAGFETRAFDLSDHAVEAVRWGAKEQGLEIEALSCDMANLPYESDAFDCLLAYHVISHTDTDGMKRIMAEIKRVLRPGGECFLTFCSKKSWSFAEAGYPVLDGNTVVKVDDGPENGIPHFYSDESTIETSLVDFRLLTVRHVKDIVYDGKKLRNSWHYFVLAERIS